MTFDWILEEDDQNKLALGNDNKNGKRQRVYIRKKETILNKNCERIDINTGKPQRKWKWHPKTATNKWKRQENKLNDNIREKL